MSDRVEGEGRRVDADRDQAMHDLEHEFAALFARVRRMYLEYAARLAPGLSPGAYKMFSVITSAERVRPSELSERMMVDKSLVSRMLRELEAHELIERMPDPEDRRSSFIVATASGQERLAAVRAQDDRRLRRSLEAWDIDDIRSLTHLLHALSAGEAPGSAGSS
ncbi:MarR family winged helix-turn-helix transcriptional regulator [Microbacterium sp. YJN-G]|uniref:MarR family winged helix-turn-helix transcriptional regulator n=1 Tax=Microbacterium sp. YJN-G TaxID=2763257 RepID=UPI001877E77B|nr:MarR family transcriptional regulator [Microbacterium sp. YJN-G]